jgi:arginase family enzyme
MLNLSDYFDAIDVKLLKSFTYGEGFYGSVWSKKGKKQEAFQVALVGVLETRNSFTPDVSCQLDEVRRAFYQLAYIHQINIYDLGNLKPGKTVQDTYAALSFVTEKLIENKIIPVFFGGTQDLSTAVIKGLLNKTQTCEIVYADSRFDYSEEKDFHSRNYIRQIINTYQETVQQAVIAFQNYYTTREQQRYMIDNGVETLRLGAIRSSYNQIEPLLRDADFFSFDLAAIKNSDFKAAVQSGPNGLYSEEACQLLNLAGISDKLKAVGIFEYNTSCDADGQSAQLLAQLIWHFILGVSQRKGDWPTKDLEKYKKIYVRIDKTDMDILFYQNTQNNRYWVEIQGNNKGEKKIIACSEKDYKDICNNNIPDRIWKNISRLLK